MPPFIVARTPLTQTVEPEVDIVPLTDAKGCPGGVSVTVPTASDVVLRVSEYILVLVNPATFTKVKVIGLLPGFKGTLSSQKRPSRSTIPSIATGKPSTLSVAVIVAVGSSKYPRIVT
jgi:hypothetical protein